MYKSLYIFLQKFMNRLLQVQNSTIKGSNPMLVLHYVVVQNPTNVARHRNSTSPPISESLEPLQRKPQGHDDTDPEVGNTSSAPIESTQKPPFGCGCGKYTFFSFILKRCPKPTPTASSFPLLDFDRLTDEQQQELKDRFWSESRSILM